MGDPGLLKDVQVGPPAKEALACFLLELAKIVLPEVVALKPGNIREAPTQPWENSAESNNN